MRKAILLLSLLAFASFAQAQPVPSHAYSHAAGSFDTINLDGLDGSGLSGVSSEFMPPLSGPVIVIPDSGDGSPGVYSETTWASTTGYQCGDPDGCQLYLDGAAPAPTDGQQFSYTLVTGGVFDFIQIFNWDASPLDFWDGSSAGNPVTIPLVFNATLSQWQLSAFKFAWAGQSLYSVMRNDGTISVGTYFTMDENAGSDFGSASFTANNPSGTNATVSASGGTVNLSGEIVNSSNAEVFRQPQTSSRTVVRNESLVESSPTCVIRITTLNVTSGSMAGGTFHYAVHAFTGGIAAWEAVVGEVKWAAGKASTPATGCAVGTPMDVQQDSGTGNTLTVVPSCVQLDANDFEFRLNASTPLAQLALYGYGHVESLGSMNGIESACP